MVDQIKSLLDQVKSLPWGIILILGVFLVAMAAVQNLLFAGVVLLAVTVMELVIEREKRAGHIDERMAWTYRIVGLALLLVFAGLVQKRVIPLIAVTGDTLVDTVITAFVAALVSTAAALSVHYLAQKRFKLSSKSAPLLECEWFESTKRDE
jgi:hypothetical protein